MAVLGVIYMTDPIRSDRIGSVIFLAFIRFSDRIGSDRHLLFDYRHCSKFGLWRKNGQRILIFSLASEDSMFFPCFRSTCEVSTSDQLARSLLAGWIGMQTAVMCNVRSHTVDYTAMFVVLDENRCNVLWRPLHNRERASRRFFQM